MHINRKLKLARLTSGVLNPFLVSFLTIILLSFHTTSDIGQAIKWSLISAGLSILPILAVIVFLVRNGRLESIFINARRKRNKIYLLGAGCMLVSLCILRLLGAPPVLIAAFLAGLLSVLVFMFINLKWKISVHTGFISSSVAVLIILYGAAGALTVVLIPLTGWARVRLDRHSPAQVVTGAFLAAVITFLVFYSSGLLSKAPV